MPFENKIVVLTAKAIRKRIALAKREIKRCENLIALKTKMLDLEVQVGNSRDQASNSCLETREVWRQPNPTAMDANLPQGEPTKVKQEPVDLSFDAFFPTFKRGE